MEKIMIVGASILQLPAIKRAKDMGLTVVAVDMDLKAVGFGESGVTKEVISTIDIRMVLEAARKHKINGIMTLASDMPMRTVSRVSTEMNLVGVTEETALKATNKILMRQALFENNVPIPLFYKVVNREEFFIAVEKIKKQQLKCILKPSDNSGSRGIELLTSYDENYLNTAYEYTRGFSRSGEIVVEEFMEGPEVSVETLSINGECHVIQITDKITTGSPYFVEMGHSQPSQLDYSIQEKIIEITQKANRAIGILEGPSHTEIIVTKDGPKIVELGARLGGDNITTHLVPLSTGVDMVECSIQIALGKIPDFRKKITKASAIKYLEVKKGRIISINGIEEAENIIGIKQISIVKEIGYLVEEITNSGCRVGFVIAQADTVEEAIQICNKALAKIEIIVA